MKKIALTVVALLALTAAAVVTNTLATDDGGVAANHSQGVAVFPYSKLKAATSKKTIPFYTTAAAWPTTFVPQTVAYDGGCQKHTLTETPATGTPTGLSSSLPTYCVIDLLATNLDAGTVLIYKDAADGGYGLSFCPNGAVAFPVTALPAFCYRQAGISP